MEENKKNVPLGKDAILKRLADQTAKECCLKIIERIKAAPPEKLGIDAEGDNLWDKWQYIIKHRNKDITQEMEDYMLSFVEQGVATLPRLDCYLVWLYMEDPAYDEPFYLDDENMPLEWAVREELVVELYVRIDDFAEQN